MILRAHLGMTPFLPSGLNSLAMCALTLYPLGHPRGKVSTRSDSACYSRAGSNRLPQSYMVLRSLYGLRPEISLQTLQAWVGQTSTRLIYKSFQNTIFTLSINCDLQLSQNKDHGGLSHPRLFFSLSAAEAQSFKGYLVCITPSFPQRSPQN